MAIFVVVLVVLFIAAFLVALRESYWQIWAPILDTGFFWFCFLISPVLLVCGGPEDQRG